jgi:hypothetical protein
MLAALNLHNVAAASDYHQGTKVMKKRESKQEPPLSHGVNALVSDFQFVAILRVLAI